LPETDVAAHAVLEQHVRDAVAVEVFGTDHTVPGPGFPRS
jgi:hypothetical protein